VRVGGTRGALAGDTRMAWEAGREVRLCAPGQAHLDTGKTAALRTGARLQLEHSNLIRLEDGRTGLLQVASRVSQADGDAVDWEGDSHWLARFMDGVPLVLLRRAVFAELRGVVQETCAGVGGEPSPVWRVALGVHDCFLDGSMPFRAGKCPLRKSADYLMEYLRRMGDADSLRELIAAEFGFTVDAADVRLSPTMFASPQLRAQLRRVAGDPALNLELLALGNKAPCWTQIGAYYRKGEAWPWEITREVYFTFVDVRYRQQARGAGE